MAVDNAVGEGSNLVGERYVLLERLDAGGMGEVWKAADQRLGDKHVAVKRMPSLGQAAINSQDIELFRREALSASKLQHPNVVSVTDFFVQAGAPFIVMEYVRGQTLSALIRPGGVGLSEAARLGAQVASALAAAHEVGLTHRDVKPANVIVRPSGTAVLVDFGIARASEDPRLTSTGSFRGTICYAAPEVFDGHSPSPACDIWSLGATLFELVNGRRAFDGPTRTAVMTAILVRDMPTSDRQDPVTRLIAEMLDRDSSSRPTAVEVRQRLLALTGPERQPPPPPPPPPPPGSQTLPDSERSVAPAETTVLGPPGDHREPPDDRPGPQTRSRRPLPAVLTTVCGLLYLLTSALPWATKDESPQQFRIYPFHPYQVIEASRNLGLLAAGLLYAWAAATAVLGLTRLRARPQRSLRVVQRVFVAGLGVGTVLLVIEQNLAEGQLTHSGRGSAGLYLAVCAVLIGVAGAFVPEPAVPLARGSAVASDAVALTAQARTEIGSRPLGRASSTRQGSSQITSAAWFSVTRSGGIRGLTEDWGPARMKHSDRAAAADLLNRSDFFTLPPVLDGPHVVGDGYSFTINVTYDRNNHTVRIEPGYEGPFRKHLLDLVGLIMNVAGGEGAARCRGVL